MTSDEAYDLQERALVAKQLAAQQEQAVQNVVMRATLSRLRVELWTRVYSAELRLLRLGETPFTLLDACKGARVAADAATHEFDEHVVERFGAKPENT